MALGIIEELIEARKKAIDLSRLHWYRADSIDENYVFQYGAMKVNNIPTRKDGKKTESLEFVWSQMVNIASFKFRY